jgi:hypothetical protein
VKRPASTALSFRREFRLIARIILFFIAMHI